MLCSRTVVLSVTVLWVATVPILYCSNCSGTKFQRFTINNPQAKCLDGSSPAFYLHSADTSTNGNEDSNNSNDTKWVVYFEGGGWCHTHEECVDRMATSLGSSTNYEECLDNFYHRMAFISHNKSNNPLMYSWNRVYVRYCDGGSYAGDSEVNYEVQHY